MAIAPARPAVGATPFVLEAVDTLSTTGEHPAILFDAAGRARVGFASFTDSRPRVATASGATWAIEAINTALVGLDNTMALDSQGRPRFSMFQAAGGANDLVYAARGASAWTVETVDSPGDVGRLSSLALDASDNPHVSYYDNSNTALKFAKRAAGAWTIEGVDAGPNAGSNSAIAVDGFGIAHVSYYDGASGDLDYATRAGGVWTLEIVDAGGSVGSYSSIAVDAQGNPAIAYHDATSQALKFARKSGATWILESVEIGDAGGRFVSLALDVQGNPRVSYIGGANDELRFASRGNTAWTIEVVDATAGGARSTSVALDAYGNPHIAYQHLGRDDLRVANGGLRAAIPAGGTTWAVGSMQTIGWIGSGAVDLHLSVDGGRSFELLRNNVVVNAVTIRVPHAPTRFAQLRLQRSNPLSIAFTDSFFTIDATIALAKFEAREAGASDRDGDAVELTWETRPGPEADVRYRVERALGGGDGASFVAIHDAPLIETTLLDHVPGREGVPTYRLVAINGLGEEYVMGEARPVAALAPARDLLIYPNPVVANRVTIAFRLPPARDAEVAIVDVSGRVVRRFASPAAGQDVRLVEWDARDASGRLVPAGLYLARITTDGGVRATERLTIVR
jgi:hypothetical protein